MKRTWFIISLACAIIIASCSPAKKVLEQQQDYRDIISDYHRNNPPGIDTNTRRIPGQPIFITGESIKLIPDTAALRRAKDSMMQVMAANNELKASECNREISEAWEAGRQQALDEFKRAKIPATAPDTIIRTITPADHIDALKNENAILRGRVLQLQQKESWFVPFLISAGINILLLVMLILSINNNRKPNL